MPSRQHAHIESVLAAVTRVPADDVIHASWQRCARDHRLDPASLRETVILPQPQIRAQQDEMGVDLRIARSAARALHAQVGAMGYVVLVANARGVTVDFVGDLEISGKLRRAGLWLGADWNESLAGTNGVGTCIATHRSITVHQDEHFDAANIALSCTTAPVFDSQGELLAVVDVSALVTPGPRESQRAIAELVRASAASLERALFEAHHRADWIVRLGSSPHFLDARPEMLVAVDANGRIVGADRAAARYLAVDDPRALLGRPAAELLPDTLERFVGGPVAIDDDVYVRAAPPSVPRRSAVRLPAPLARLSAGDASLEAELVRASRLADSGLPLLLCGETGTGKEWLARALHASSPRRARPFVAVNCAAIPAALVESELFGHEAGSFSGARASAPGLVRAASGGTLLLDEIGELPLAAQAALLRVLSEREVLPVGATRPVPVDVRVLAATHRDLEALVAKGAFRADLLYRLDGARITLPPLRVRSDLAALVERVLVQVNGEQGRRTVLGEEARTLLLAHDWPGNLRELHNALTFAASVAEGVIVPDDLPARFRVAEATEADALERSLRDHGWNLAATARELGIARMTLYQRMKRLGIATPNHRS